MEKRVAYKSLLIVALTAVCVYFAFPLQKRINLGLDLQGGMHLLLKVDTAKVPEKDRADAADRAVEVIRNRIDQFGVREPSIQRQGADEIIVQLPGVTDRERAIDIIGKTAQLEFTIVSEDPDKLKAAIAGDVPEGYVLKTVGDDKKQILIEDEPALTGNALVDAFVQFDQSGFTPYPTVALRMNSEGAKTFAEITSKNLGKRLAIVLDGAVQSAPVIEDAIPNGEAVIRGSFSNEEAQDLAVILRVGALPAPMYIEEERTVGPLLGKDSIEKGVKASVVGLVLVFAFMFIYYLLTGVVSSGALLLNLIMILGGMGMLPLLFPGVSATLTLPGIAGIVLSLGMAVDANVLINERIREELASGRTLRQAIGNGYNRAFSAILDSNVTTLVAAAFLFWFGTGPIRGFAVTLTIGLLASMFTAVVVTRTVFELLLDTGLIKKSLPMLRLIGETKIDFIGKRKIFFTLSLLVIVIGCGAFFKKGAAAYGIDFAGGQVQEYLFEKAPQIQDVRATLKDIGLADATIQQFKDNPRAVLIKTTQDKNKEITDSFKARFPGQKIEILKVERVGPVAGSHLKKKANLALFWSLVGILVYVAIRFKHMNFAVAGVLALFHDVLVTLGALALTGRPIDLLSVTAFLTIAGYSINDTIVIYDRVRENARLLRKLTLKDLINLSVNQTLGRTILTSSVTLLTVIAILIFGGEVLGNFAFALLVGFISGVYSTVYIASPLIIAFSGRKSR